MPRKLTNCEEIANYFETDSENINFKNYSYYSLKQDKQSKIREMARLDCQYNLADQLLSKVTDKKQQIKLLAKKKESLVQKNYLEQIIFDISYIESISKECVLIFEFIANFYNFNIELFESIDEDIPLISKKLHALKVQEEMLIKLNTIDVYLKNELNTLKYHVHKSNFVRFNKIFFDSFVNSKEGFFCKYVVFSEKIHDSFAGFILSIKKDIYNIKRLEAFILRFMSDCTLPSNAYNLVGTLTVFLQLLLFRFLVSRPITANLVKLKQFIKFNATIFKIATDQNILKNITSLKNNISNLETEIAMNFTEKAPICKDNIGKQLSLFKETSKKIIFFKDSLRSLFNNNESLRYIALMNLILMPEKKEKLLGAFKSKTGLDFTVLNLNKIDLDNIKTNNEVMNYFLCTIYIDDTRNSLYKIIQKLIVFFPIDKVTSVPILENLTAKDFVSLAYFCLSVFFYVDLNAKLNQLESKLAYFNLCALNIYLLNTLKSIDSKEKIFSANEDKFLKKKYSNVKIFLEDKKSLLDEIVLILCPIEDLIAEMTEFEVSNIELSQEFLLNLQINIGFNQFSNVLMSEEKNLNKLIDYLKDCKAKFNSKKEFIERYSLPAKNSKIEVKEQQVIATSTYNGCSNIINLIEIIFEPLLNLNKHLANSLLNIENYVTMPKKSKKNKRRNKNVNEKFFSGIGQIRSSINIIAGALSQFYEGANFKNNPNLNDILKKLTQCLEKSFEARNDKIEEDDRISLFKEALNTCCHSLDSVISKTVSITKECEIYNTKMVDFLDRIDTLENTSDQTMLDECNLKEIEEILTDKFFYFKKQISMLDKLVKLIKMNNNLAFNNFYKVVVESETFEKIINCIKRKAILNLRHSVGYDLTKSENTPNLATAKSSPLEKSRLLEITEFNAWNTKIEAWKLKRDSDLVTIFNTIEECPFAILNRTASSFLKILFFYKQELTDNYVEFKEHQHNLDAKSLTSKAWQPIKEYMFQHKFWFENILARIVACINFIYESSKSYHSICLASSEADHFQKMFTDVYESPEFASLLTAYLTFVDNYNRTKTKLDYEQKNLASLNSKFISKIIQADSLEGIEQEAKLILEFNKKLIEVNHLGAMIKQTLESKKQIKNELIQLIGPDMLNFYISRIDPSDIHNLKLTPEENFKNDYAYTSSNFFCLPTNTGVAENYLPLVYFP